MVEPEHARELLGSMGLETAATLLDAQMDRSLHAEYIYAQFLDELLFAVILVAYLAESNFFVTAFGERHDVVGVVVSQVQEGNGIKGNTYLTVANIDGQEQTLAVIQALGSTDYALYGTCVESGTVTLQSGLGNLKYPFYIQVA